MPLVQPQFLQQTELKNYGLPNADQEPDIVSYVQRASSLIDTYLGRTDSDGNGSLIYTTYTERLLLPEGRNVVRLSYRPLVAVEQAQFDALPASATNLTAANTGTMADGVTLTPILVAAGRYGYGRRAQQQVYPDLNYGANILQIASYFGGPPQFTPIDISSIDFDPRSGEVWLPAGLYLSAYTEVQIQYNAGFNPYCLPNAVKQATAMVILNFLSQPSTNQKGFSVGRIHTDFTDNLIDPTVRSMLQTYRTVIAL